jgi:hypothetical protein
LVSMRTLILGILCACSAASPVVTADNYIVPPTVAVQPNITKYVKASHRASLNFACSIQRITVTPNFDTIASGFVDPLTQIELEDHLGDVSNIEWSHVMQTSFASTDPRGQERQLGTLGGDLGEFLLVLAAIEAQTSTTFTDAQVLNKLQSYLTVMSKDKFYYSIDLDGLATYKQACSCPQLNLADPPDSKKPLLTNATHNPASQGDELFKTLLTDPTTYQVRKGLVTAVLDSFFTVMWKKEDPLHRRIRFVLLKGTRAPKGFIVVKTPGYCNAQLLAPLISPELCNKQMSIYSGDAAVLSRTEIAGVLLLKNPDDKNAVVRKANDLASVWLTNILATHNEPVYTVSFEGLV